MRKPPVICIISSSSSSNTKTTFSAAASGTTTTRSFLAAPRAVVPSVAPQEVLPRQWVSRRGFPSSFREFELVLRRFLNGFKMIPRSSFFATSVFFLGVLCTPGPGPSIRTAGQFSGKSSDCPNCIEDTLPAMNRWTMPLLKLGEKRYYLGIFFKANYFRATQYCRFHGMHLASITSQEENDKLEKYIKDFGFGNEHFWTSGTDLADEGNFFWMSTGRPITFTNWNAGEPNNFEYENGEQENCLELWNRDGKGLKWNDSPCSFETYFVCEVQS